jgi:hypothetical protein
LRSWPNRLGALLMATFSIRFVDAGPWMGLWEGTDEHSAYCNLRVVVGRKIQPALLEIQRVFPVPAHMVFQYGEADSGWLWFLARSGADQDLWDLCSYQSGGRSFRSRPAPAGLPSAFLDSQDV